MSINGLISVFYGSLDRKEKWLAKKEAPHVNGTANKWQAWWSATVVVEGDRLGAQHLFGVRLL